MPRRRRTPLRRRRRRENDATTKAASDAQMKLAAAEREFEGDRRRYPPCTSCQHGVRLLRGIAGRDTTG